MKLETTLPVIVGLALTFASVPASAQWVHQEQGNAFDTEKVQIVLTARGQYAVGLRCTSENDLTTIFITSESVDQNTLEMINAAEPEILVRVDQNEPHTLDAEGDIPEGKLTLRADAPPSLASELIEAKSRVSVAARMLGSLYHETEFNVRDSTASVTKLVELCGLPVN